MTVRILSDEFRRAAFSEKTREAVVCLLTISDPSFPEDIRLCDDAFEVLPIAGQRGVVSRGDEFIYIPFGFELPNQDATGIARARLSVDNVSREIVKAVRQASASVSIKFELVLSRDVDAVEFVSEDFKLEKAKYDALTVSGELSMEYFDQEPFPSGRFTNTGYPGMF